jgi:hypothetical protein
MTSAKQGMPHTNALCSWAVDGAYGFSANNPVSAPGRAAEAAGWYAKPATRALLPDLMLKNH